MEYLYLVVGAAAPIVVFFAVWNISKKRVAQAQESAKVLAESQAKIIQTRLESELAHANEKIEQLQRSLDLVKAESADAVDAVKRECKAHYDEALAAKEAAFHDAAAAAQKIRESLVGLTVVEAGKCDFCPSEPTDCKKLIFADGSHICVKDMSKQPSKAQ